jgi:hypothetical protein
MAAKPQHPETETGTGAGAELLQSAQETFGPLCRAAWLSGSYAYEGARPGHSDADIVIVLDERVTLPADEATLRRIRRFVDSYLAVHARHGLDPDLEFPGEFVTSGMIEETIAWRGLAHEGGLPEPAFPAVESRDYWLGRPDRWYNAWLSETAFSRFPVGDRDYHDRVKLDAWTAIVRFLLLRAPRPSLTPDELLLGVAQFGVKPRYPAFWDFERPWVDRALETLAAEGAVGLAPGRVEPRTERLREWEATVREAIVRDRGPPPLLLDPERHRDIEQYAARRWATLQGEGGAAAADEFALSRPLR